MSCDLRRLQCGPCCVSSPQGQRATFVFQHSSTVRPNGCMMSDRRHWNKRGLSTVLKSTGLGCRGGSVGAHCQAEDLTGSLSLTCRKKKTQSHKLPPDLHNIGHHTQHMEMHMYSTHAHARVCTHSNKHIIFKNVYMYQMTKCVLLSIGLGAVDVSQYTYIMSIFLHYICRTCLVQNGEQRTELRIRELGGRGVAPLAPGPQEDLDSVSLHQY